MTGGSGFQAGGSVDSTAGQASTGDDDAGSTNPDEGEQQISMPPLLMIAAYRYIRKHHACHDGMVFVPLLQHLADDWQDRELTDVSVLVAKLFLWRHVMNQDTVQLSKLLGGIELARCDIELCVPTSDYEVHKVGEQLSSVEFEQLLRNAECQWAFIGPHNHLSDSWLLLRRAADHALVVVYLQSKKRQLREAMQYGKLVEEAAKRWDVPGVEDVMLYVTDQHPPRRSARRPFQAPKPMVLIEPAEHARFYGACASLLKSQPTTKRRR